MASEQIELFMAAIRRLESGSYGGDYNAQSKHRHPVMGVAQGAYQIMSANWPSWSAAAGIPGANWRSQAAQDHVARYKMMQYYEKYGSWDLVAIAWFGGGGAADQARATGIGSLSGRSDANGTSIPTYVKLINTYMADAPEEYRVPGTEVNPIVAPVSDPEAQLAAYAAGGTPQEEEQKEMRTSLRTVLEGLSSAVAGGERQPLSSPVEIELIGEQTQEMA